MSCASFTGLQSGTVKYLGQEWLRAAIGYAFDEAAPVRSNASTLSQVWWGRTKAEPRYKVTRSSVMTPNKR